MTKEYFTLRILLHRQRSEQTGRIIYGATTKVAGCGVVAIGCTGREAKTPTEAVRMVARELERIGWEPFV